MELPVAPSRLSLREVKLLVDLTKPGEPDGLRVSAFPSSVVDRSCEKRQIDAIPYADSPVLPQLLAITFVPFSIPVCQ